MSELIQKPYKPKIKIQIGENYKFSPTSILAYLLKNNQVKIIAKKSWFLTDDYQSEFKYKEYVFELSTTSDSVDIMPLDRKTRDYVSNELYHYIKSYEKTPIVFRIKTWVYLLFLPFNYKP